MSKDRTPAIIDATGAFCRSLLDAILPSVRRVARFHGYAVAVHGSLSRDIDLVAVAWTDTASGPAELVQAVRGAIASVAGNCLIHGGIEKPTQKPHGRIAYTMIHPGFIGDIDLSIIPPAPKSMTVDASGAG